MSEAVSTPLSDTLPVRIQGLDFPRLVKAKARLPHALLFSGMAGLGKLAMAKRYAQILLCHNPGEVPCGQCAGCCLNEAGHHPDYQVITLEEKATAIKVDQIRGMLPFLQQTPQQGHFRIVIIHPAERLNMAAANSLLKVLEEPGKQTVLFLVTSHLMLLPATLRSRCVCVPFLVPERAQVLSWLVNQCPEYTRQAHADYLAQADGAPLTALALAEETGEKLDLAAWLLGLNAVFTGTLSPVALAKTWEGHDLDQLLLPWLRACHGIAVQLHTGEDQLKGVWREIKQYYTNKEAGLATLYVFIDSLLATRRLGLSSANPNSLLLLESLLLKWYAMGTCTT